MAVLATVSMVVLGGMAPLPPNWGPQFSVPINQTIRVGGETHNSMFMYYYDAVNNVSRTDHGKGQYDEMCRSIIGKEFSDEACSFFVALDGWRYLYFPADKEASCCKYCNKTEGCGIIKKNWLDGATYQGQLTIEGHVCNGWLKMGGEQNFYYATADAAQQPCLYYEGYPTLQRGINMWNYSFTEYIVGKQDPSLFQPWPSCDKPCHVKM
eukprot:TRINITY_DN6318_c0_g1_i1.p2 TRINITY_DN6318_c0_g1~~TRINITY_DN6318_c0_g1_i1.p2  ORF type:complete len:210 (+),score=58.91 TRINITY_DN6318_c0_g1_i1:38-667(+)